MARPRKENKDELRTDFFGFQVTPAERAEIDRRAASSGLHRSEWGRRILLSDLKAPAPPARDPAVINAVVVELNHHGNNLNQLTRIANERRDMPSAKALAEVLALIKATLEKLFAS
jgi:hypothetical protein